MKNLIILALLLLASFSFAANWTLDGNTVYWTANGYTIRAYPATSNELINHVQYVNFTSTNPASILVNLSFVFDKQPSAGDVQLWQNLPHEVQNLQTDRLSALYQVNNVLSYSASTAPCQLGDDLNLFKYNVTYQTENGTLTGIACFDSSTNIGSNYTLNYSYNYQHYVPTTVYYYDWGSTLTSFQYASVAGKHVYTIYNVPFNGSTNYQTKFSYSFPISTSGKFSIYAHGGSPIDVVAGFAPIFVELDPWWSANWTYKIPITVNTTSSENVVNFPFPIRMNTSNSTLWGTGCTNVRFLGSSETVVLPYDLDTSNATFCGNATNNATFYVTGNYSANVTTTIYAYLGNTGAASGENAASVWALGNYISVYHAYGSETRGWLIDETGRNNMSNNYATSCNLPRAIINGRGAVSVNGSIDTGCAYSNKTTIAAPAKYANMTVSSWAKATPSAATLVSIASSGGYGANLYGNPTVVHFNDGGNSTATVSGYSNGMDFYALAYNNQTGMKYTYHNTTSNTSLGNINTLSNFSHWAIGSLNPITGYESYGWSGNVSETRIRNVTSTAGWLAAEYGATASVGALSGSGTVAFMSPTPDNGVTLTYSNLNFSVNSTYNAALLYVGSTAYAMTCNLLGSTYNCTRNYVMPEGNSSYYAHAYNSTSVTQNGTTEVRTLVIDTAPPSGVSLVSPLNGVFYRSNVTINLTYTDSSPTTCQFFLNNTNITVAAYSTSCVYQLNNSAGNYTVVGYIKDFVNYTTGSSNISFYTFNFSANPIQMMNPELDIRTDSINLTVNVVNYFGTMTADLEYNGTNYTATNTAGYTFSTNITPVGINTIVTIPLKYFYTFGSTSPPLIMFSNNTTTLSPGGLMLCGNVSNATSINYTILNSVTFEPINATLTASIFQSPSKFTSFSINLTDFKAFCINPVSFTSTAFINETWSATGYSGKTINRLFSSYFANSSNFTIYMDNSTASYQTVITVINNNNEPLEGYFVKTYQQNTTSNTYYEITTSITDISGKTTQLLTPNTIFYQFAIYDTSSSLVQSYSPAVISCNTLTQTVCYVTLIVGQITELPYISTFNYANASCTWNNATGALACTPIGATISTTVLDVLMTNATAYNSSICSQSGVGVNTVTCMLPTNPGNCYQFAFRATLNTGETPDLGGGQVCVAGPATFTPNNGTGLILTFILMGFFSMIGLAFGPAGMLIGCSIGIIIAVALSFLTGIFWFAGIGAVAMLWLLAWIVK